MSKRGLALAIALALLAAPAPSPAERGDVYVADPGRTTIWKFAPSGGEARVLVFGAADPTGMALDRDGSLVVAAAGLDNPIYRVNRNTGARSTIVSDVYPVDVALAADGTLYATTFAGDPGLISVDPPTGNVEFVAGDHASSDSWSGLALTRAGIAYVADTGGVIRVIDIRDGSRRGVLSDPLLEGPWGVALTADERFLYVAGATSNNIVRFNVRTGQATEVVSFANPPAALGVSVSADGSLLVSRGDFFSPSGILNRVGPFGSPVEVFSDDSELEDPQDIVIEPKRCRGMFPTVVGTTGRDKLKGSKYADVITTLGGNDRVNAGKGNDIVCGGKGKDKLKGGKGKDKLKGGPGKDVVKQ
jgi:sugar lactone lactonase YvrE